MFAHIRRYAAAPVIEGDEEKTRVASVINLSLLALMAMAGGFVFLGLWSVFPGPVWAGVVLGVLILLRQGAIMAMRRGQVWLVSLVWALGVWGVAATVVFLSGGLLGPNILTYTTAVLIVGLGVGGQAGLGVAGLSILSSLFTAYFNLTGRLPHTPLWIENTPAWMGWGVLAVNLAVVAALQYLAWSGLNRAQERVRRLVQEAVEAEAFQTRLLSRVSHELRNPTGAILGLTEMLHYETRGPLTSEQRELTLRIINNANYLRRMMSELLDQARMEAGQIKLGQVAFQPDEVAQKVVAALSILAQNKGLALQVEAAEAAPLRLVGDPDRLEQILFNLVDNAVKFTDAGAITIRISRADPAHWSLQVTDTGVGIPASVQTQIFEPFWQMNQSTARKFGGVGLGLSIVKQLVDLMRGQITLESQVGRGSTFTIVLPLTEEMP